MGGVGGRLAAVATVCALLAGCTPNTGPTTPSQVPTSASPTESDIDRQMRLDYEAAEVSYRAFRKEYVRVLSIGGAREPTTVMKETAAGPYLAEFVPGIKAFEKLGYHQVGAESIVYVRRAGYNTDSLLLDTCEDGRMHTIYDNKGEVFARGEVRTAEIEVRKVDGMWKLWSADGKKVKSCD